MILESENVKLVPFSEPWNMEYLWTLIQQCRFNKIRSREAFEACQQFGRHYWIGYTKAGERGGVVFLNYIPQINMWTLDAYRDDLFHWGIQARKDWSFEAGKLVCNFFFQNKMCDILFTAHSRNNIHATRVCKRLGFKENDSIDIENIVPGHILLAKLGE